MKQYRTILGIIFLFLLFLSACSQSTELPTELPTTEIIPTSNPGAASELSINPNLILNKKFKWVSFIESDLISQAIIEDPENYTIIFHEDGTLTYKAACNTGSGTYGILKENIAIEINMEELESCGQGSLENMYIGLLNQMNTYSLYRDQLSFEMKDFLGGMGFLDTGETE